MLIDVNAGWGQWHISGPVGPTSALPESIAAINAPNMELAAAWWTCSAAVISFPATPTPPTIIYIPNRREIRCWVIEERYEIEIGRYGEKDNLCIIQMELRISFEQYLKTSKKTVENNFRKFNQMIMWK